MKQQPTIKDEAELGSLRGDMQAALMQFRQECLEARSELYKTHDVTTTTDRIIKAQEEAETTLTALFEQYANQARVGEVIYFSNDILGRALAESGLPNHWVYVAQEKRLKQLKALNSHSSKKGGGDE